MSYPLLLLGHQLAVLTGDGSILSDLDQQLDTRLTLLSEHDRLPAYPLLQTAHLLHGMGVTAESASELGALGLTGTLNLTQFMNKPGSTYPCT